MWAIGELGLLWSTFWAAVKVVRQLLACDLPDAKKTEVNSHGIRWPVFVDVAV